MGESLSFPKAGDDPWRRTPDILVSEDVPPIFLQMRVATSTDVKPSRRGVPNTNPVQHFPPPPRKKNEFNSVRKRLHSDDMSKEDALEILTGESPAGKRAKVVPTEEEKKKRDKRAERFAKDFGNVQAAPEKPTTQVASTTEELEKRRKREDRFAA